MNKKYPKKSEVAKALAPARKRGPTGRFSKNEAPITPPKSNVWYQGIWIANPAPVSNILYNPDQAFIADQDNASRMYNDLTIFSALQERMIASIMLPWSIVPQDDEDEEQQYAADSIEDIIRGNLPNIPDFFRCLNFAMWVGRGACYLDYRWDFSTGRKRMLPKSWTPVHGDTLVFGVDGQLGYRVANIPMNAVTEYSVEGRYIPVGQPDMPNALGNEMLSPQEREAWVVHHWNRTPGEYRLWRTAASKWGIGLRSTLYNTWMLKINLLQFIMQNAEKFGAGWLIGYFDMSNPASANIVAAALRSQVGSTTMTFPRSAGEDAPEGIEVLNPPSGMDNMIKLLEYYNNQIRQTICGEELTAASKPLGIGGGAAEIQENTFGRLVKYDSQILAESVSKDLVGVLQQYNGFGHLPPLRLEFSMDLESADQKIDRAAKLFAMNIRVSETELLKAAGFRVPRAGEVVTNELPGEKVGLRESI